MSTFIAAPMAYGQSQPLVPVLPMPVEASAAPGVNTRGVLGQINIVGNSIYMLVGITAGGSQWVSIGGANGAFNAVTATTTVSAGTSILVGGDAGAPAAGVLALTNVLENDQDAADLTIKSTTANPGDNAGFIKAYIGATVVWIPYFSDIAP